MAGVGILSRYIYSLACVENRELMVRQAMNCIITS